MAAKVFALVKDIRSCLPGCLLFAVLFLHNRQVLDIVFAQRFACNRDTLRLLACKDVSLGLLKLQTVSGNYRYFRPVKGTQQRQDITIYKAMLPTHQIPVCSRTISIANVFRPSSSSASRRYVSRNATSSTSIHTPATTEPLPLRRFHQIRLIMSPTSTPGVKRYQHIRVLREVHCGLP